MATTSFPSSRWNGMIQLPLLLMPPLGTWFNSCYLPSSNCKNMVQLLLHPMLALLLSVWFNSCYIPYLLVYLQHGSTLVTSHAKSFIYQVQQTISKQPHAQSISSMQSSAQLYHTSQAKVSHLLQLGSNTHQYKHTCVSIISTSSTYLYIKVQHACISYNNLLMCTQHNKQHTTHIPLGAKMGKPLTLASQVGTQIPLNPWNFLNALMPYNVTSHIRAQESCSPTLPLLNSRIITQCHPSSLMVILGSCSIWSSSNPSPLTQFQLIPQLSLPFRQGTHSAIQLLNLSYSLQPTWVQLNLVPNHVLSCNHHS